MSEPFLPRRDVAVTLARCIAIVGGISVLYAVLPYQTDNWWVAGIVEFGAVAAIVPLTVRRLRRLRVSERPVADAVEGMTALLTILIFGFSALYLTLNRDVGQFEGLGTRIDAVYFTLTTLSTVGFGDIHASGQAARFVVSIQILMNFLLIGVVVRAFRAVARQRLASTGRTLRPGADTDA
jgi:hypothetical protein